MKQFTGSALLLTAVLASPAVLAADMAIDEPIRHTEAFFGFDTNSNGSFFGFTVFHLAPDKGGLDESGLRFWLLGGAGFYRYPTDNEKIRGTFWNTDALVGYSIERDYLSVAFYVGLNAEAHQLSVPDPENPVQGAQVGVKFRTHAWYNPTPMTLFFGEGEYSTVFETYYTSGKYGYSVTGGKGSEDKQLYVGPQITLLGNERYQEWRIGAHVTSFNFGKVDFEIGAGYQHNTDWGSGAYATGGININF
jgi:hypothetical protein